MLNVTSVVVVVGDQMTTKNYWGKASNVLCPWGKYTTFLETANCAEISSAVSILRSSTRPSPALPKAAASNSAAWVSPSALMTAAFLICSAFSTRNLAFSASCWATCFNSTARVNSRPKVQCVILMSSRMIPNCSALLVSSEFTLKMIIRFFNRKRHYIFGRAFRTSESESESESADFSEVRVRKFRTLKTLRTWIQRVCFFTHLYSKEVNISQKNSEISIFSFLKSYYSLYKPHAQISTIAKTS
jgi:hypothetical protein